jgi:branched-chain amino acid transport system ATP-binding protein
MSDLPSADGIALEVDRIDSFYGELQVLRKASLRLYEGEIVALFGPNGHGKSTLLKALSGIHPPQTGSIIFRGKMIIGLSTEKIVEMGIALIPEARNLFTEMTVIENLNMGAYNRRARHLKDRNLEFVFSLFPRLKERMKQLSSTLSGGESRMLAVARGLMSAASLLLIDEPSVGLSPLLKKAVFNAIGKIGKETDITSLIVEQEVDYSLKLSDRVYVINKGQIIIERSSGKINKTEIEKAYF